MAKIVLSAHYWWNDNSGYCFGFSQNISSKIVSTTMKVYDVENNGLVLSSTDSENHNDGYHLLTPNNLMELGKEYILILYVNYRNSSNEVVQSDIASNMIDFEYISHPYFTFENLPSGSSRSSSYSFLFTYNQAEDYPLSDYTIRLINHEGQFIASSGIMPVMETVFPATFEWLCRNLENGNYRLQVEGRLTTTGADISFEQTSDEFSITINPQQTQNIIKATNNPEYRNVKIETEYRIYSGRIVSGNDPVFDDGTLILDDETLEFDDIDLSGNLTVEFSCSNLTARKKIFTLSDSNGIMLTVVPFYEKVCCEDSTFNNHNCLYLNMRITNNALVDLEHDNQMVVFTTHSNYILCSTETVSIPGSYNVVIHAIDGRYDIHIQSDSE